MSTNKQAPYGLHGAIKTDDDNDDNDEDNEPLQS